jgi:hypothetical protein
MSAIDAAPAADHAAGMFGARVWEGKGANPTAAEIPRLLLRMQRELPRCDAL